MNRVEMTLSMRVVYSKSDGTDITEEELAQLRRNLDYLPMDAAGRGALTSDAWEVEVDTYEHTVSLPQECHEEQPVEPAPPAAGR